MTLENAIARVEAMIGAAIEWTELIAVPARARSRAAIPGWCVRRWPPALSPALELAKQGKVEIAQAETFAPLMLRKGRG